MTEFIILNGSMAIECGQPIAMSGYGLPIGIAMNDAIAGEVVNVVMNGMFDIPVDTEYKEELETDNYEVPTINMEGLTI